MTNKIVCDAEKKTIIASQKSLKQTIDFLRLLLKNTRNPHEGLRAKAVISALCVHRYIHDNLVAEVETRLREFMVEKKVN